MNKKFLFQTMVTFDIEAKDEAKARRKLELSLKAMAGEIARKATLIPGPQLYDRTGGRLN